MSPRKTKQKRSQTKATQKKTTQKKTTQKGRRPKAAAEVVAAKTVAKTVAEPEAVAGTATASELAPEDADWQGRFEEEFAGRFQRAFDLTFEGKFACNLGDHERGIELLTEALALAPDSAEVKAALADAYPPRIAALRSALASDRYNPDLIARMQTLSEGWRQLLAQDAGPAVTAVMPVFLKRSHENGVQYLFEALDSVITQDFEEAFDIAVIDDCSEIDVAGVIRERYGERVMEIRDEGGQPLHEGSPRRCGGIRIVTKKVNSGNDVAPRNLGLVDALRRGSRYITHIDSDDRMVPGRLKTCYRYLEDNRTTDMVHGRHRCIDTDGEIITGTAIDGWHNFHRMFTFGLDQNDPANEGKSKRNGQPELELLQKDNWVHGGAVMYRSNVLLRIGLDNLAPTQRYGADHVFWQKMSLVATMDYLARLLTEHRVHEGSMTQGGR